jgi:hypothetical protein
MKILFPLKFLVNLTMNNKLWVYFAFFLCVILAIINGYSSKGSQQDPYVLINFIQPWNGFSWVVFVEMIKFLYTPIGLMIKSLLTFLLFLFLIYIFSGAKKNLRFMDFILPFIGLVFLGIILQVLSLLLSFASLNFPYLLVLCIVLYLLIFYCLILVKEFNINLYRSIFAVIVSILLVFLISGFPSVAPYLAWI